MTMDSEAQDVQAEWSKALGGLLHADAAAARAGVDLATLLAATTAGKVIAVDDHQGRRVYPGCQFKYGWPGPPLIAAWRLVAAAAVSPWTACSWLVSPDDGLDGRSPVDYARDGSPTRLMTVARHDAARLAQ